MTEIINFLKKYTDGKQNTEKVEISALQLNRVIKALEQEPILDKIRAEVAEYKDDKVIHAERNEMIDIVLEIIDKYKAEGSDKK